MKSVDVLKAAADLAFKELTTALEGVTEAESWAVLQPAADDYLHSDGSVHGITLHIATCKMLYGSCAFRNLEIRWRDLADEVEKFEPSWPTAMEYLSKAQKYWLDTWADLTDDDLDREFPRFRGELWPAWKLIETVIQHDVYHSGQIALIRYATQGSSTPPPSVAEDIRKYCADLPSW